MIRPRTFTTFLEGLLVLAHGVERAGSSQTSTSANAAALTPKPAAFLSVRSRVLASAAACDNDTSLVPVPPSDCPADLDLDACDSVEEGQLCEGDGECSTDDLLNNCGDSDVYLKMNSSASDLEIAQSQYRQEPPLHKYPCVQIVVDREVSPWDCSMHDDSSANPGSPEQMLSVSVGGSINIALSCVFGSIDIGFALTLHMYDVVVAAMMWTWNGMVMVLTWLWESLVFLLAGMVGSVLAVHEALWHRMMEWYALHVPLFIESLWAWWYVAVWDVLVVDAWNARWRIPPACISVVSAVCRVGRSWRAGVCHLHRRALARRARDVRVLVSMFVQSCVFRLSLYWLCTLFSLCSLPPS
ncbi:unnamed protein product [Prorocentrum cordatum]|uniref:Transmembrane protein 107 n=1 Tax=Prorocentrum cordatum TaxID=2364126 RepID=A0ABN9VCS8_9DINO|nr:unnamed protein product [Polarella glacialis]